MSTTLKLRSFPNAQAKRSTDVDVSEERLLDFDDLAAYFAENDNREQYTMTEVDEHAADLLVRQIKQYARANRLTSRPEQDDADPRKVTFRFVSKREKSDNGDSAE